MQNSNQERQLIIEYLQDTIKSVAKSLKKNKN